MPMVKPLPRPGRLQRQRLLTLLAAGLLAASTAAAGEADPSFGPFAPFGKLQAMLDGQLLEDAEIFYTDRPGAYLVQASGLDHPLLINVRTQQVERLRATKIRRNDDGTVQLLKDAVSAAVGPFEVADAELTAVISLGRRLTLGQKPDLLGLQTAAEIIAFDPAYGYRARQYPPSANHLAQLRGENRDVTVRIFFGSWCSTCARYLPWLMSVEQELEGSSIRFEYYGLPHTLDDPQAKELGINGVPTAVVSVGGQEIGRRDSTGLGIPEQALADILGRD